MYANQHLHWIHMQTGSQCSNTYHIVQTDTPSLKQNLAGESIDYLKPKLPTKEEKRTRYCTHSGSSGSHSASYTLYMVHTLQITPRVTRGGNQQNSVSEYQTVCPVFQMRRDENTNSKKWGSVLLQHANIINPLLALKTYPMVSMAKSCFPMFL